MRRTSYSHDITIISPNNAIDSYYVLSAYQRGGVNRALETSHTAGGKGINMARAVRNLGGSPLCIGILGGHSGKFIVSELQRENIDYDMVWTDHETRRCSTTWIEGDQDNTVILDPGEVVEPKVHFELREKSLLHAHDAPFTVLIGSLPPGFSPDYYASLVTKYKEKSVWVCIDCSAQALHLAADAGATLIKVNAEEFCLAFGFERRMLTWHSMLDTYQRLVPYGTRIMIITDGAQGAYVFGEESEPFKVRTQVDTWISTAGAGDTFMAGILLALGDNKSLKNAATAASAAAAASTQKFGCGIIDPTQIDFYLRQTSIEILR
ncbi:MAG: PfkB family carbohydrate kinase [Chloroflexota bacterium]